MTCKTGKIRYRDRVGAMLGLAKTARGGSKREEARVYRCEFCGGWHLTSKPKRTKPKRTSSVETAGGASDG